MYIIEKSNNKEHSVQIEPYPKWSNKDSKRFGFDWSKEENIFRLILKEDIKTTLGLMSLKEFDQEFRISIELLESSKENVGRDKKFERIAGCLIAYACNKAYEKFNDLAAVSLVAKTELIPIYREKYGFIAIGGTPKMFVEELALKKIIKEFYGKDIS